LTQQTIKIFIPMAGFGTRLRPHTWSRPKQLINVADRTVLDHVLNMFGSLPHEWKREFIFIVGYLGEKIKAHMDVVHPNLDVKYVIQEEMLGQSHALYLGKEYLSGPMLMVFADTLIESDLAFLADESADGIAWVKPVPDPRRFGVAITDTQGWVERLVEKPQEVHNNLAVVGCYYVRQAEKLLQAIEEQMQRDTHLKGEYYLADAFNIALEDGLRMRTHQVEIWLDAGTPEDVLSTNRYLLEHGHDNSTLASQRSKVAITPPVFVHPEARVENAILGPYVSIGADCHVENCILRNTILETGATVMEAVLEDSLVGQQASVQGKATRLFAGDDTLVEI
jgi:glucose-1-phosphate thymidylyltransferase